MVEAWEKGGSGGRGEGRWWEGVCCIGRGEEGKGWGYDGEGRKGGLSHGTQGAMRLS